MTMLRQPIGQKVEQRAAANPGDGEDDSVSSGSDDDALVLRAPVRPTARRTALAAVVLAVGGLGSGVYFLFAGVALVGVALVAWSAYVVPGWWRAMRRAVRGPEVLRMDSEGVTVCHGSVRGEVSTWSIGWPNVRSLTVHETALHANVQERAGPVTKVLSIDVVDHREVEGPSDHRERLLRWALLIGSTTSRTRLQVLLGMVGPAAARRIAAWLAAHQPGISLEVDVTGAGEAAPQPVPSRVAVLVARPGLRSELVERMRTMGLSPLVVQADDAEALTEQLRTCTAAIAVDTDAGLLSEAAARAGLDRVLLAVTPTSDPAALLSSDRAWTVLNLEEAQPPVDSPFEDGVVADATVALLEDRESLHRVWRVGPDGAPVAAEARA
jgi:hypothetical protein